MAGRPTVRRAEFLGGYRMTEKRIAGGRKATGNRDRLASPLRLVAADNWPDTGPV